MKYILIVSLSLFALHTAGQEHLQRPEEFLGYAPGTRFTLHHRVVEYFRHIANAVPNARIFPYGRTHEGRPLFYIAVTAPGNFGHLDEIRLNNLRRTGLEPGPAGGEKIALVWLSYNVHGNEASSMEAAMVTLYELVNPDNAKTREWLEHTVVIIDPCINPDGRDRYANFYHQHGNRPPNPDIDALEHHEPWPGGRSNHYYFDLNRDWAWLIQTESQQRIREYNRWMPHIHVDFHEQGHNSPYYFAPAAEPMHEVISPWQKEFQVMIGKNNARHFDEHGWLYFTKEVFDLYYPSYGDTYPTYSGAIGMTYEQAGGGVGGLEVTTQTGDALTLRDRITHHHTAALSTIEIASRQAARIVDEFEKYFHENNNQPTARYKTYVIKGTNNADDLRRLTEWMDTHRIRYGRPASTRTSRGFSYQTQSASPVSVESGDLIVNIHQPKSRFITTVFEPSSHLSDSLTYDITAWNLLYAYNLNAWALTESITTREPFTPAINSSDDVAPGAYAYLVRYQGVRDAAWLSALLQSNVKVRVAQRGFTLSGQSFDPGTLIITRHNNEEVDDLDQLIRSLALEYNRKVISARTGFVEQGRDLGSGHLIFMRRPSIAVLTGDQTSSLSVGEIWHFFEQEIGYPITLIGTDYLKDIDLSKYDVLIAPDGKYSLFDDATLERLATWVNSGGRLILISGAMNAFADKKGFSLKRYASDEEKARLEGFEKKLQEQEGLPRYDEAERRQLSHNISGAIYKLALDNSHPLGFGLRDTYYTLKTHEHRFARLDAGWNVAWFGDRVSPIQGFAGYRANASLRNSLLFGVEPKGQGEVVYLVDNPLFRGFWESGKMIFANAVFMSGR